MKITANVVYPIYGIEVEVQDDATEDEIREAFFVAADSILESSGIQPLITECSLPNLVDA